MTTARFKTGKREEAVGIIDRFAGEAEDSKGFKGIWAFYPLDDPNKAILITTWETEEDLNASQKGIFQRVMREIGDLLDGPPDVKFHMVKEMSTMKVPVTA